MTTVGQLWFKSSLNFALPGFSRVANSQRWSAPGMRAVYWPDGLICWQVNCYLVYCRRSGKAVSTVNTYASELSIFVRFLYESHLKVDDVCDDAMVAFSDWLLLRKSASGNHINRLLLRVISFLEWCQAVFVGKQLVGPLGQGAQVTITLRSQKSRRGMVRARVQHHSMVPASVPRTVRPVSTTVLSALVDACEWAAKTNFRRSRDRCILVLMADTGVRREELTWIRSEDVFDAVSNGGRLAVRTSKRKGNPYREIPVSIDTLSVIVEYIEVSREIQIRKLKRKHRDFQDQGWAFCSRIGSRLAPSSISQLFSDLRSEAGITERVSAHMLRHRYITLQVMARLRSLNHGGAIGVEALTTVLSKVASLSGHSSLESMWRYVDWAYDELEIEFNDSTAVDEEALGVLDRLLKEAMAGNDRDLVGSLTTVRGALTKSGRRNWELPSVISHSLRGGANKT